MPTWNKVHIERHGRWIYRIEDSRYWDADFGELGRWTNRRWWKIKPKVQQGRSLGNTGMSQEPDADIAAQGFPAFASIGLPGILRIAYPRFIHYEFYVPSTQTARSTSGSWSSSTMPKPGCRSSPATSPASVGCSTATSPDRITGWWP